MGPRLLLQILSLDLIDWACRHGCILDHVLFCITVHEHAQFINSLDLLWHLTPLIEQRAMLILVVFSLILLWYILNSLWPFLGPCWEFSLHFLAKFSSLCFNRAWDFVLNIWNTWIVALIIGEPSMLTRANLSPSVGDVDILLAVLLWVAGPISPGAVVAFHGVFHDDILIRLLRVVLKI